MAVDVGTLHASLTADTSKFTTAMTKAGVTASKTGKQIQQSNKVAERSLHSTALRAAAVAGAISGVYGAYRGLRSSIKYTEDLAKGTLALHRVTGMDLKTSSKWVEIARVRGVESKALSMGFLTLATNIRNAEKHSKTQVATFRQLGISQRELKNQSVSKTMLDIADAFKKSGATTDRAAIAKQLFGRQVQTLLPILAQGSSGLKAMMDQMDKLGFSMDRAGVKKAMEAVNAQRNLQIAIDKVRLSVGTALTPALARGADALTNFISRIGKITDNPALTQQQKWAKIGDVIGNALASAMPQIANKVAAVAPKVAAGFVRGFVNANTWGQIAIGAFLVSRLIGWGTIFRSVGSKVAAAFAVRFIPGMAAAGASGGAAAAGAEGIMSKSSMFGSAGKKSGGRFGKAFGIAAYAAIALAVIEIEKNLLNKLAEGLNLDEGQFGDKLGKSGKAQRPGGGKKTPYKIHSRPGSSIGAGGGGGGLKASGGPAGGLSVVGERGPELVSLPSGSYVHSHPDSKRMLGPMAGMLPGFASGGPGKWHTGVNTLAWGNQFAAAFGLTRTSGYRSHAQNVAKGRNYFSWHEAGSPSNPGASDFVPQSVSALNYAKHNATQAFFDSAAGPNLHVGFFSSGNGGGGGRSPGGGGRAARPSLPAIVGKLSTFGPPGEGAGSTAYGFSSSHPGIAVNPNPPSGWNSAEALKYGKKWGTLKIGNKSIRAQVIDKGPAIDSRKIDVTGALWEQMGGHGGFPTDKVGSFTPTGSGGGGGAGGGAAKGPDPNKSKQAKLEYDLSRATKKKDKLRALNALIAYWRTRHRQARAVGNWAAAKQALDNVRQYQQEKRDLMKSSKELYTLGGLSQIGTGGKAFHIGALQNTLDFYDNRAAKAALTGPTDDTPAALTASLQDDIAVAKDVRTLWQFLYDLTLSKPGTMGQQTEAAGKLIEARDNFASVWDQAYPAAAAPDTSETDALYKQLYEGQLRTNAALRAGQAVLSPGALGKFFAGSFAAGGVIPGPIGAPRIALVHGGETVTPNGAGGVTVIISGELAALDPHIEAYMEGNPKAVSDVVMRSEGRRAGLARQTPGTPGRVA